MQVSAIKVSRDVTKKIVRCTRPEQSGTSLSKLTKGGRQEFCKKPNIAFKNSRKLNNFVKIIIYIGMEIRRNKLWLKLCQAHGYV